MTIKKFVPAATLALAAMCALGAAGPAQAQDTIKVGVIAAFSGPFADYGKQMEGGIKAWMAQNGATVAGKKVEIIIKDTTGPAPEIAKRLAQELVVRDKVDFLAGFGLTPEALAVAPIAEQAKKPMIIMNAATSVITTFHYSAAHKSPENAAFLKSFAAANPGAGRPNFMAVAAYDGMAAIYEVSRKLNGKIDGDQAMAILKNIRMTSPRGPISIDPATRDIVQTVYVRKVEKVGNEPYNVEFDQFDHQKDPGK